MLVYLAILLLIKEADTQHYVKVGGESDHAVSASCLPVSTDCHGYHAFLLQNTPLLASSLLILRFQRTESGSVSTALTSTNMQLT